MHVSHWTPRFFPRLLDNFNRSGNTLVVVNCGWILSHSPPTMLSMLCSTKQAIGNFGLVRSRNYHGKVYVHVFSCFYFHSKGGSGNSWIRVSPRVMGRGTNLMCLELNLRVVCSRKGVTTPCLQDRYIRSHLTIILIGMMTKNQLAQLYRMCWPRNTSPNTNATLLRWHVALQTKWQKIYSSHTYFSF